VRAYIEHGVENPALYSLMFGGYLSGPDHGRPTIELAEAEKTKGLLRDLIIAGGLGRPIRKPHATIGRLQVPFWHAGPSCMASLCCWPMGSSAQEKGRARCAIASCRACSMVGGRITGVAARHLGRPAVPESETGNLERMTDHSAMFESGNPADL